MLALRLLKQFVDLVLGPANLIRCHTASFLMMCEIVELLELGDAACSHLPRLQQLITKHHSAFVEIYPMHVKPKLHYLLHIPSCIERLGKNLNCFATERKHRGVRKNASSIVRHHDITLTRDQVNCQVNLFEDATACYENQLERPINATWALDLVAALVPEAVNVKAATRAQLAQCGLVCRGDVVLIHERGNSCVGEVRNFFAALGPDGGLLTCLLHAAFYQHVDSTRWSTAAPTQKAVDVVSVKAVLMYTTDSSRYLVQVVWPPFI